MQESGEEVTPSAAAAAERLLSFSLVYNDLFSVEKGPVSCRSNCLNTSSSSVGTITANGDMRGGVLRNSLDVAAPHLRVCLHRHPLVAQGSLDLTY